MKGGRVFSKAALNKASPYIGLLAVAAKTKVLEIGKATGSFLKRKSGGKVLSLTEVKGNGLRLGVF